MIILACQAYREISGPNNNQIYLFFRLYYFAMNHTEVYACLRVLLAQTGMNPTKTALFSVIRDLHSKPRTLKQLNWIRIYNSINFLLVALLSEVWNGDQG